MAQQFSIFWIKTTELWLTKYIIGDFCSSMVEQLCIRSPLIKRWSVFVYHQYFFQNWVCFYFTETYNQTGINYVKENWYAQKVCDYIIDCEGQSEDSKILDYCKALIVGFVILRVTERLFYVVNVWFHHNACDR